MYFSVIEYIELKPYFFIGVLQQLLNEYWLCTLCKLHIWRWDRYEVRYVSCVAGVCVSWISTLCKLHIVGCKLYSGCRDCHKVHYQRYLASYVVCGFLQNCVRVIMEF